MNKPYFSVVIPLYNKQSHVKETIQTVLAQTFQDFEIVVVNDGSKDDSVKIVQSIEDRRIRIIHQENQGVSVARNKGIKESSAEYIAFLDADDIWLPDFLKVIYDLTIQFPNAGMFSTQYEKMDNAGNKTAIKLKYLPSKEYVGIIPNYFKSVVLGDNIVWTSALCIPKKVFIENNIWFPVGEKYGEDQHVWARVAMLFDIAYNTKVCALYMIEAENNTIVNILKEKDPHESILSLRAYRDSIKDEEKLKYFDKYIEKNIINFIILNMERDDKKYALKQFLAYKMSMKNIFLLSVLFLIPYKFYPFLKRIKNIVKK